MSETPIADLFAPFEQTIFADLDAGSSQTVRSTFYAGAHAAIGQVCQCSTTDEFQAFVQKAVAEIQAYRDKLMADAVAEQSSDEA
jgi:hypothetical protein